MDKRIISSLACALLGSAAVIAPAITQTELLARLDKKDPGLVVLDVRTAAEFAAGHVPGAPPVSPNYCTCRATISPGKPSTARSSVPLTERERV